MRTARRADCANAATVASISALVRAWGTCQPSPNGVALEDTVCHGSSLGASGAPPSHGRCVEALRPACASWIPNRVGPPRRRAAWSARSIAASLSTLYRPRQACVMRPRRSTAVASTTTSPAPEYASCERCCRCQSVAEPSLALYWHIGATTRRFGNWTAPIVIGSNRRLAMHSPTTVGPRRDEYDRSAPSSQRIRGTRIGKPPSANASSAVRDPRVASPCARHCRCADRRLHARLVPVGTAPAARQRREVCEL